MPPGVGPLNPVPPAGRDGQAVPRFQVYGFVITVEEQARRPAEQEDEFALRLVVPETGGRAMAPGDDPLDLYSPVPGQDFGQFAREPVRDFVEEISFQVGGPPMKPF